MEKECIIFIIIIILILLLYRWIIQRKEAIDNVLQRTDEEKIKDINDALDIYGFIYDKNKEESNTGK